MLIETTTYGLNDVAIVPAAISSISSRKDVNPYLNLNTFSKHLNILGDKNLPLFTAPMANVVGLDSYETFSNNGIIPILPRTIDIETRISLCTKNWCAFGLTEFYENFIKQSNKIVKNKKKYVLIDIANGNMEILMDYIKKSKKIFKDTIVIMAGNVANSTTYKHLSLAGADFIRVGIGGGLGCTTTSNVGIHYPIVSLIDECNSLYTKYPNMAYIVADGGIRGYSDIIKCLALGAHFVMCGSVFNKMYESSGELISTNHPDKYIDKNDEKIFESWKNGEIELYKEYFGMSTKKAQTLMGKTNLHTGEGRITTQKIEYTMSGWVENFTDFLRSAMSYCNIDELEKFTSTYVNSVLISNNSFNSINK